MNKMAPFWLSRMKNRNGRSMTIVTAGGAAPTALVPTVTAVAAAWVPCSSTLILACWKIASIYSSRRPSIPEKSAFSGSNALPMPSVRSAVPMSGLLVKENFGRLRATAFVVASLPTSSR